MEKDNGKLFLWKNEDFNRQLNTIKGDEAFFETLALINKFKKDNGKEPFVLEAGCGLGRVVYFLTTKLGFKNIYGVELNKDTVNFLNSVYKNLKISYGNILDLDEKLKNMDIVLSYGVVEHFKSGLETPMKHMFEDLKPGGFALVTVPFLNGFRAKRAKKDKKKYMEQGYKYYPYLDSNKEFFEYRLTKKEFISECKKAGFKVVKYRRTGFVWGIREMIKEKHMNVDGNYNWKFSLKGKIKFLFLKYFRPAYCAHMQLCILQKPKN